MIFPGKAEIVRRLVDEFGYSDYQADVTADDLRTLNPGLRSAFARWWYQGNLPEITVEGYTVVSLVESFGFIVPGAILMLDWLIKEPEEAKGALSEGFDTIEFRSDSGDRSVKDEQN